MRPSFSQPPTAGEPSAKSQRHVSSSAAESSLFLPGMPAFIKVCPQICCLTSVSDVKTAVWELKHSRRVKCVFCDSCTIIAADRQNVTNCKEFVTF